MFRKVHKKPLDKPKKNCYHNIKLNNKGCDEDGQNLNSQRVGIC